MTVVAWLILEDGRPSMAHSRYMSETEAKAEVDRINALNEAHNRRIDEITTAPDYKFSRGDAFRYQRRIKIYTYERREFSQ